MLSRRLLVASFAAAPFAVHAQATLTDDGLHKQPWFLESFLEMAADLEEAAGRGKRLAVLWELRGCPACRDTHLINFARPDVAAFIRERFEIVQMNVIGDREVTDFDGERLPEKRFAEKYGVRFTPTIQYFPPSREALGGKKPREREVARLQGYLKPDDFMKAFAFVAERAYERTNMGDYLKDGS
jgi:thioredoxin-related protein